MKILGNRVLVEPLEKEVKEGFQTVEVQDSFLYKGRVEMVGEYAYDVLEFSGSTPKALVETAKVQVGDTIIFAKYSPDTHEFEHEEKKYKSVLVSDIIAVL